MPHYQVSVDYHDKDFHTMYSSGLYTEDKEAAERYLEREAARQVKSTTVQLHEVPEKRSGRTDKYRDPIVAQRDGTKEGTKPMEGPKEGSLLAEHFRQERRIRGPWG